MFFRAMTLLVLFFLVNAREVLVASDAAPPNFMQQVWQDSTRALHIGVPWPRRKRGANYVGPVHHIGNRGDRDPRNGLVIGPRGHPL